MTTKITIIFDNPESPDDFEADCENLIAKARKIPYVLRMETAMVWPKEDGTPTPAHRLMYLYLPDYDIASQAVTTVEAGEFLPAGVRLATGDARAVFAEVEDS